MSKEVTEAVEDLKKALAANINWEVNYVDVKHLNDLTFEYRAKVLKYIHAYRIWKQHYEAQRDIRAVIYGTLEGEFIRRKLEEALKVYRTVRREAWFLTDVYISQCKR